uniref:Clade I nitrous oxide reductase n=1 Tax=Mesocestoides corti TaxID=53468 RepID=A0A5K3EKT7_MESCO
GEAGPSPLRQARPTITTQPHHSTPAASSQSVPTGLARLRRCVIAITGLHRHFLATGEVTQQLLVEHILPD